MNVLVTGAAGFIGFHLARRLAEEKHAVTGLDNLNDYYDVRLKEARLEQLRSYSNFSFHRLDLDDARGMDALFRDHSFEVVVNLAAQAGVRYSLTHPRAYMASNLSGFLNVLEGCRHSGVRHLVYASSSSVYGANGKMPFSEHDAVDHPVSLYAASKKANELMAHSYAHLYGLPCTGLRFFTVYGPWGRPDMAMFIFAKAIREGKPIEVFHHGRHRRDFTYIDDIIEGVRRVMDRPPSGNAHWKPDAPDAATSRAPYRVYNIGNHRPVEVLRVIELLESSLGATTEKIYLPMQPGDVPETCADVSDLMQDVGFRPATPVEEGIRRFVDWYLEFYGKVPGQHDCGPALRRQIP